MNKTHDQPALFSQQERVEMAHESRQSGRAGKAHDRMPHGGFTCTLRVKADRRRLVTRVDPASERRRG
jgi:hypothetical protein